MGDMKKRVSVTLTEENVAWLEARVKDKTFGSKSHGIDKAVSFLREHETT